MLLFPLSTDLLLILLTLKALENSPQPVEKSQKMKKKEVHEDLGSASSTDRPILSVPAVYGLVALLPTRREKD